MAITSPQGFNIQAAAPIDDRYVRDDIAGLNAISAATRYEGLLVYVKDADGSGNPGTFQLSADLTTWEEFAGGLGIDDAGAVNGHVVYYNGSEWVSKIAPLYYPTHSDNTKAATHPALAELSIKSVLNMNAALVGGHGVSIAPYAPNTDPLAVYITGKTKPALDVRKTNSLYGVNASDVAKELITNAILKVEEWAVGSKSINLAGANALIKGITGINTDGTFDLKSTNALMEMLKLNGELTDANSVTPDISVLEVPINLDVSVDRTANAYSGVKVTTTGSAVNIKELNAFEANIGNLLLKDGEINLGPVAIHRGDSYINIKEDDAHAYIMYVESISGGQLASIDKAGKFYSRDIETLYTVDSNRITSTNVSKSTINTDGNPTTDWALVGTMTINPTTPTTAWNIKYQHKNYTTIGEYHITSIYTGTVTPIVNVAHKTVPGTYDLTGGAIDMKAVAIDANTIGIYVQADFTNGDLIFTSAVYGGVLASIPLYTSNYDTTNLPAGTVTNQTSAYDSYWDLDIDGHITSVNDGNVLIKSGKEFHLDELYKSVPSGGALTETHIPSTTVIRYIDAAGNIGWRTNSIVAGENTSMAGIIGITSLRRVGAANGNYDQGLFWDETAQKYLPKAHTAVTSIALDTVGDLDGTVYKKTLIKIGQSGDSFLITDTGIPTVTSSEVTLPDVANETYSVDAELRTNDSIKPVYLKPASGTVNGLSQIELILGQVVKLRHNKTTSNWELRDNTITENVIEITSNTDIDRSSPSNSVFIVSNDADITFPAATEMPDGFRAIVHNKDRSSITITIPGHTDVNLFGLNESAEILVTGNAYLVISTGNLADIEQTLPIVSSTFTWDMAKGATAKLTLTKASDIDVTNISGGETGILRVIQDNTGGYEFNLPANSKTYGTVEIDKAADAITILSFYYDGTDFNWTSVTSSGLNYSIGDLTDVTSAGAVDTNILKYNGSVWEPKAINSDEVVFDKAGSNLIAVEVESAIKEVDARIKVLEDSGGGAVAASAVTYINTASGLDADNAQDALDEIVVDLEAHTTAGTIHTSAAERLVQVLKKITTIDPTVDDDADAGYTVGYTWINTSTDMAFTCVDTTNGAAVWSQGGGSHTIQDSVDSAAESTYTARTFLRWLSKNGSSFISDLGAIEDATEIALTIEGMNDLDATGKQAGSVLTRNIINDGHDYTQSVPYDGILPPSPEAGITGTDATNILLSTIWIAGHTVGAWITNETVNAITGFKITDNTNDLFTAINLAANESKYVVFDMQYASQLNDIDLYTYAATWNSGTITFKQTQIKH